MFTGIVEETGRVLGFEPRAEAWSLRIAAEAVLTGLSLGDSIAVNGCCLTAAGIDGAVIRFDVLEETRRLTNLAALGAGGLVNLERSLSFGGKVGGHFVTGHIDATGTIDVLEARGRDHFLRVRIPREFGRLAVRKGSIAIDGISLTVAEAGDDFLSVWIIPHTREVTNLAGRRAGDAVNLEFDLLAKHVERLLAGRQY